MFSLLRFLHRRTRRFRTNRRGGAGVEFALVSPVFFAFLFSLFEAGLLFTRIALVEDAARTASRQIYVGAAQRGSFTQNDIENIICDRTFGFFSCADSITVEVRRINGFNSIPTNDATCDESGDEINPAVAYTPGARLENLFVRVCATVPVITPGLGLG